ncbi:hypothetical protein GCM10011611_10260 [Aliidongia dinghuensis]|uniref:PqqD family protein n=2 Tax=Aliidongia dinghuensis TaxID=1867774 RepID=A0A8J2YRN2_9PROT|nr:hypothetical protein GCM10011611_10260 [Aliidongia dinghuensis]
MGTQTVLMSIDHGKYIGLDAVGTAIWQRLAEPVSVRDLCAQLMSAFTADAAELRRDVLAFLTRLHAYGLVDIDPA